MKLRNLFFVATACTGLMFTSCSNEMDNAIDNGGIENVQAEAYAAFSFVMPSAAGTRAGGDVVEGTSEENQITNVAILLFDGSGNKVAAYTRERADFTPVTAGGATKYTLLPAKYLEISTAGNYQVHVIVNPASELATEDIATLTKYNAYIETVAKKTGVYCTADKFMMTNATAVQTVGITLANKKDNPAIVTIPVERLAAKITFNNSGNTKTIDGLGKVKFDAYKVINTRNDAFKLRRVSKGYSDFTVTIGGTENANYVLENRFDSKNSWDKANIYDNFYSRRMDTYVAFRTLEGTGVQNIAYALENTMMATASQQKGYTTGVILRGKVTLNTDQVIGTVTQSGTFYKFRSKYYATLTDLKDAFADDVLNVGDKIGQDAAAYLTALSNDKHALYKLGVELFANGNAYYYYWIRHNNDKNAETNGHMEYDIVRNNVYQLSLGTVTGIGSFESGTPGPKNPSNPGNGQEDVTDGGKNPEIPGSVDGEQENEIPVIPVKPEEPIINSKMYLDVSVQVLPWVVRDNIIDL